MVLPLKRRKSRTPPGSLFRAGKPIHNVRYPIWPQRRHRSALRFAEPVTRQVVAGWSSPVARQAHNLKVAGSNPAPAPKLTKPRWHTPRGFLLFAPDPAPTASVEWGFTVRAWLWARGPSGVAGRPSPPPAFGPPGNARSGRISSRLSRSGGIRKRTRFRR